MPKAVLAGLKKYPFKISVICAMLDSGGSSGRLRKDYKIVSPGDIRRAFIALANTSPVIEDIFNYRFQAGVLKDHNFANLLITALEFTAHDYEKTFTEMRRILNINQNHEVLPATLDNVNLYAVLENGKVISGETNIDIPKHDGKLKIKRVFLKPKARAYPKALEAIAQADLIIIGPGDLYSSLAQILLSDGISEAMKKSRAKKVYVCNLMTKYGETNNFQVADFAEEIENYLSVPLDYVIFNNNKVSARRLKKYKKEHPELLDLVGFTKELSGNKKFIGADLVSSSGSVIHDSGKLTKIILQLCGQ